MNATRLQTLLEFDSGEFHAHQCGRVNDRRTARHREMSEAQDWLLGQGLIELVGEEFFSPNTARMLGIPPYTVPCHNYPRRGYERDCDQEDGHPWL